MIGRRAVKIGSVEPTYPLWITVAESPGAGVIATRFDTADGGIVQVVRKREIVPATLDSKDNEWLTESDRDALIGLYNSLSAFTIRDENGNEYEARFDYTEEIRFEPCYLGACIYYTTIPILIKGAL